MTGHHGAETVRTEISRLAAAARSILSCPAEVQLVVDGVDDVTADLGGTHLEMHDRTGHPVFSCPAGSALAAAATERRAALLTVDSGLGRPGSADRDASLTLSGRLSASGAEQCPCSPEARIEVRLHVDYVLLSRPATHGGPHLRVPVGAFTADQHELNRGFLQRAAEHANLCHQAELRRAVAATTGTHLGRVLGVHLHHLRRDGVDLQWVDPDGGHARRLTFARPAATSQELGELLRSELHAGLC
ncbi:hypothetical protein [Nocardioides sp. SYSU DS0651]|uniref:hypothetical protein n=1 Tax=Nocardioides sp. SYSU DS0651 TaxID=3415955 RepID=UPI003F4C260F